MANRSTIKRLNCALNIIRQMPGFKDWWSDDAVLAKVAKSMKIRVPSRRGKQRLIMVGCFLRGVPFKSFTKARPAKRFDSEKFNAFYTSKEWRKLRYRVLRDQPHKCACCGSVEQPFHVDHVKPRFKYPELELDYDNLQILCEDCNMGKGGWDETDWRTN